MKEEKNKKNLEKTIVRTVEKNGEKPNNNINNNNNKVKKVRKLKKIKIGYVLAGIIILFFAIMIIKLVLPSGTSKYGDRLDGIEKIKFGDDEKNAIINNLKAHDGVTEAKIDVEGKIIYVIYNVSKEKTVDEARNIGNDSLELVTDEVKNFYDMNYIVTKNDEEGTTVVETNPDDGTTTEIVKKEFPIMGYKNKKSARIVW